MVTLILLLVSTLSFAEVDWSTSCGNDATVLSRDEIIGTFAGNDVDVRYGSGGQDTTSFGDYDFSADQGEQTRAGDYPEDWDGLHRRYMVRDGELCEESASQWYCMSVRRCDPSDGSGIRVLVFNEHGDIAFEIGGIKKRASNESDFTIQYHFELEFPVSGYDFDTAPISAIMDHSPALGSSSRRVRDGIVKTPGGQEARIEYGCTAIDFNDKSPTYLQDVTCINKDLNNGSGLGAFSYQAEAGMSFKLPGLNYLGGQYLAYDGHAGVDIAIPKGTSLLSTGAGRIRKATQDPINGHSGYKSSWEKWHTVVIDHGEYEAQGFRPNGWQSWYLHLDTLSPSVEALIDADGFADVGAGDYIGTSGDWAYGGPRGVGDHLHFQVTQGGSGRRNLVDPYQQPMLWATSRAQTSNESGLTIPKAVSTYPKALKQKSSAVLNNTIPVGNEAVLFSDNFNDNTINLNLWTIYGSTASEVDGELVLQTTTADLSPSARTMDFEIDETKPVTIERRSYIKPANNYYDGSLSIGIVGHPELRFGVAYSEYHYNSQGECLTQGISLFRYSANSHLCQSRNDGNQTAGVGGQWGKWVGEKLVVDPSTGDVEYYRDGALVLEINMGGMPADSVLNVTLGNWGWYTGHQHKSGYITITQ